MYIFSYGSNLCFTRIHDRIGSVKYISIGRLLYHQLKIHKRSTDGSAKADAFETGNKSDFVLGVVYDIDPSEKQTLDRFEGLGAGYDEKEVSIILNSQELVTAQMYCANKSFIDSSLRPFSWYLKYIIIGATDYGFPDEYIKQLKSISSIADSNKKRLCDFSKTIKKHKKNYCQHGR